MLDLWCFVLVNALINRTYGRCLCLEGDATSGVGSLFAPLLIILCIRCISISKFIVPGRMFIFSSKATYRWIPCYILLYIETGGLKIHNDVDINTLKKHTFEPISISV